ncbi:hypothetical protein [Maribacter sp. HTCC2170]|uniref:hypothetical protein n=1 Tax=Maribacter sp. (strain HTCC2170 / KCCM 42371) TaxID=313603 RepID=UPI00006BE0E4|nr:hypothetical protein [Maribacter sp. HTCC2170]EAR00011.1 hypothetical protein FB2170_01517 [Maribacter sp. HTCC2170]
MSILESIKSYFGKKMNNEKTGEAPEGVCPNCWGKQEWEGEFYEFMKGSKNDKRDETYNNFINKIVESNIEGIRIQQDSYTCKTCNIKYDSDH